MLTMLARHCFEIGTQQSFIKHWVPFLHITSLRYSNVKALMLIDFLLFNFHQSQWDTTVLIRGSTYGCTNTHVWRSVSSLRRLKIKFTEVSLNFCRLTAAANILPPPVQSSYQALPTPTVPLSFSTFHIYPLPSVASPLPLTHISHSLYLPFSLRNLLRLNSGLNHPIQTPRFIYIYVVLLLLFLKL